MCPDQKLCREEPQNRQAKPHKQNCVFTGVAASLGEWCEYINLSIACNIAYRPEVLCQKINYESSTSGIFLGKVYIRKLVLLSRTDILRAAQLCTSCVQVLKAVMFMPMYSKVTKSWTFKELQSLSLALGTSVKASPTSSKWPLSCC